jgi:Family of unknown function (DUF5682)
LLVGDRLGRVPADVPTVPLQRDVEQQIKTLRLKAEATQRTLDLDLRNETDLARSHLLHRLRLIGVRWGELEKTGRSARGSFHEVWTLQWQPEFVVALIEGSHWGETLERAASARAVAHALAADDLAALAALVDQVLLAALDAAVAEVTRALENRAATTGDALQLLAALPPLANVFRYGNVRQTDTGAVAHVLDSLIVRAAICLPLACCSIDEQAAAKLRELLLAAHAAVALRTGDAADATDAAGPRDDWRRALAQLAQSQSASALLRGVATRLQLDDGLIEAGDAAIALSLNLSAATPPADAAAWLDGFLNRNAALLLHDAGYWRLIDDWLLGLTEDHFVRVLPLVRRTFAAFTGSERRELGARAAAGAAAATTAAAAPPDWDEQRAALAVPLLRRLLGIPRERHTMSSTT